MRIACLTLSGLATGLSHPPNPSPSQKCRTPSPAKNCMTSFGRPLSSRLLSGSTYRTRAGEDLCSLSDTRSRPRLLIEWAKQRLAHIEAQNQLDVLTSNLREQNLFPDPDDLDNPEGDPPPPKTLWG